MPLFGRRKRQPRSTGSPTYIGRKFHSDAGIEASLTNFRAALARQLGHQPSFTTTSWTGPEPAPERVIATRTPEGIAYLALWPDGAMHFVAPDYRQRPTPPLVGMWKMRDNSLRSTGSIEPHEFGSTTPA